MTQFWYALIPTIIGLGAAGIAWIHAETAHQAVADHVTEDHTTEGTK